MGTGLGGNKTIYCSDDPSHPQPPSSVSPFFAPSPVCLAILEICRSFLIQRICLWNSSAAQCNKVAAGYCTAVFSGDGAESQDTGLS